MIVKILKSVAAVQFLFWAATLLTLFIINGPSSKVPTWYAIWGAFQMLLFFFIYWLCDYSIYISNMV